jgi:hypothetical protein
MTWNRSKDQVRREPKRILECLRLGAKAVLRLPLPQYFSPAPFTNSSMLSVNLRNNRRGLCPGVFGDGNK